jgi:hypothetical protein
MRRSISTKKDVGDCSAECGRQESERVACNWTLYDVNRLVVVL